jgi:hypothetical protein
MDAKILSLIENVHRADLSPIDKSKAYNEIYEAYGTYTKVAQETGVSISTIRRYLLLLNLAPSIQTLLSTSDGPASIYTLSKMAHLFPSWEDQEYVLMRIRGFKQQVQLEILKRSKGNIDNIDQLSKQALEGFFDIILCKGIDECPFIPNEYKTDIINKIGGKIIYGL